MNRRHDQQIFDSLLEEMLTDRHPPDFSDRILEAWRREQRSGSSSAIEPNRKSVTKPVVKAELVNRSRGRVGSANASVAPEASATSQGVSLQAAGKNVVGGSSRATSKQNGQANPRRIRTKHSHRSILVSYGVAVLTVAASALIVAVGWRVFSEAVDPRLANQPLESLAADQDVDEQRVQAERLAAEGRSKSDDSSLLAESGGTSQPPGREILMQEGQGQAADLQSQIDELELSSEDSLAVRSAPESALSNLEVSDSGIRTLNPEDSAVESLRDPEVVAELDRRLKTLWEKLGVKPSRPLANVELARKTYQSLSGEEIATEELLASIQRAEAVSDGSFDRLGWAEALTSSKLFAEHWADVLTRQWLLGGSLPLNGRPARQLSDSLAVQIDSSVPWNEVVQSLLGGEVKQGPFSEPSTVFMGALSGRQNHRLLKRLGTNFLNTNLSCARCHDSRPVDREESLSRQTTYWSLAAMLKGVRAWGNGYRGQRQASDDQLDLLAREQPWQLYFERPDGRMTTADASLPDGKSWGDFGRTPREALANWIISTPAFERAVVNQTWKAFFGRHLLPQVDGLDVIAIDARRDLLGFLGEQFRAHDYDLKRLTTWIVSSDAFARQPVELTASQWLAATEEQLEALRIADTVFAIGQPIRVAGRGDGLERSLATAMKWSSPTVRLPGDMSQNKEMALAQTDNRELDRRRPAKKDREIEMPSLFYILHGERHTPAEIDFVDRLLNATQLDWHQQVEHIVDLSDTASARPEVLEMADELLERNSGDKRRALLQLLWAVKNADAS